MTNNTAPEPKSTEHTMLIERFPLDLNRRAKVAAVLKDMTLRSFVISSIEAAVEESEKPKKKR